MDKAILKKIKEKLLKDKERLEADLKQFTTKNKHNSEDYDANFPSIGDKEDENANEVAQYSDNLTLERTLEKQLRDVNNTIKRIDDGKYGVCKYCKKEITPERLEARPTSSACVECKKVLTQEI